MLVGREAEQRVVDRLVSGARIGQGGALVLTGEPGIGKTALLGYAVQRAAGARVLRADGSALERDLPFAGLLQLIRPVLDLLDRIPEPQAEALAAALALRRGSAGDRFAVGAAALSLLCRCGEDQPLLIVLDDVHDLDRPSVEALVFVARRLGSDPVAVLATSRPEGEALHLLAALPRLELVGLPLGSMGALLAGHLDAPVGEDAIGRLHRTTGGNPLAVVELASEIHRLDALPPEVPLPVPEVVAEAFARRAGALDPGAGTALLLAAVADGDLGLVGSAAPALGTDVALLEQAEAAGLLHLTSGRAEFRHPLVRSSVYAAAPADRRRQAHRAVAEALPPDDLERRSWHLSEATVGCDDALADDLARVGERAAARSAYAVAATAHERSALLTSTPGRRTARLLVAGESAWLAGQSDRAQDLLALAETVAEDPAARAAVQGLRGTVVAGTGSLVTARDLLTGAARGLRDSDPDAAVRLLADAVLNCFWMGDVTTSLEIVAMLDDLADRALDEQSRVLVSLGTGLAQVLAGEPGIARIREAVDRLTQVDEQLTDPRRPAWSVIGTLFLRESDAGRALLGRAVEELRRHAALATLPNLLFHTARDEATTDRWQSAASHYEESIRLARECGQTTHLAMSLAGLAWLRARTGDDVACRDDAAEALDLAERHQVHLARAWATYALGDLELALDRPVAAIERFESLVAVLDAMGFRDVDLSPGPDLADALARTGRDDEARAVAARFLEQADAKGQPWARARAERALGLTSEGPVAEARFGRALELHALSPDAFEEARTLLAQGAFLRRRRRRVDARPPLRAALELFERLGAAPWAQHAARELAAAGAVPHHRGESALSRLTAQELQISRMLAEGRTTRETAAALFLSPKTVEYHLRHVYTKLDIHSRGELAAALGDAAEQGRSSSQQ